MKFRATLQLDGKTATGITVPDEVVEALGKGMRPAVRVTIKRYEFTTTLGVMGGVSKIPVSAAHREAARVSAGEELDVTIELDTTQKTLAVPTELLTPLKKHASALKFFNSLTPSQKKLFIDSIETAKTPETRQRRIDKALSALQEGRKRP